MTNNLKSIQEVPWTTKKHLKKFIYIKRRIQKILKPPKMYFYVEIKFLVFLEHPRAQFRQTSKPIHPSVFLLLSLSADQTPPSTWASRLPTGSSRPHGSCAVGQLELKLPPHGSKDYSSLTWIRFGFPKYSQIPSFQTT